MGGLDCRMDTLLASMAPHDFALMALGVLFAAVMRAFAGFGFALLAVPLFSLILTPGDTVVLATLLTLSASALTCRVWWGKFKARDYYPMVVGSVLGSGIGVTFLAQLSREQFQLWIGLTVVAVCLLLARFRPRESLGSPMLAGSSGLCSGLMNGAFAIPGPPAIVYAMACISNPAHSRTLLMAFFAASNVISLVMFSMAGLVTQTPFYLSIISMPVLLAGERLGSWLFNRVGGSAYRPIALVVSLSVGLAITLQALIGIGATA